MIIDDVFIIFAPNIDYTWIEAILTSTHNLNQNNNQLSELVGEMYAC